MVDSILCDTSACMSAKYVAHRAPTPAPVEEPPTPGPGPTPEQDPVPDQHPEDC
ncbi:hypothetical protein [Glaciimonas sp. PCH181]|uniref:hypothetical protein n=1 Tax=Glaciimonas sp. PCH181 TaxID=2133943 RepID=UPI0013750677|nr:hypothetical protein [Glaciimonas sp. PCH181]